jgi:hypothetical protein
MIKTLEALKKEHGDIPIYGYGMNSQYTFENCEFLVKEFTEGGLYVEIEFSIMY